MKGGRKPLLFCPLKSGTSLPSGVTSQATCWLLLPLGFSFTQSHAPSTPQKMPPQGREGLHCCPGIPLPALGRGAGVSGPFSPIS